MKIKLLVSTLFIWFSVSQSAEAQKPADSLNAAANKDTTAALRTDSLKTGFAKLRIVSQPDSAAIIVDNIDKGKTPAILDSLAPGAHIITLSKKGYFLKKINATLSVDTMNEINTILVRPGCIVVKSEPAGANLFLDNKATGVTPYENSKLKPGTYTIRLELKQHETVERSIAVSEATCDTISVKIPFLKTYIDSVASAQKAVAEKKSKLKKTTNFIVLGVFLVFGIVILGIEIGNGS